MARGKKRRRPSAPPEQKGSQPPSPKSVEQRRRGLVHREGFTVYFPKPKGWNREIYGLAVTLVLAVALAFGLQALVARPFQIPSGSMEPTLDVGERIIANRLSYKIGEPSIGDIVVFHPPAGIDTESCGVEKSISEPCPMPTADRSGKYYVKRIVAGPGDTLSIKDGHPVVNGVERTDEPYIRPCGVNMRCNMPSTITIPPDHYFMMGDNRGESADSRVWGPIPRDWIVGKAIGTYWPPTQIGFF